MKLNKNPSAASSNIMLSDYVDIDNLLTQATGNSLLPTRNVDKGKKNGFLNYRPPKSNLLAVPKRQKLTSQTTNRSESHPDKTRSQSERNSPSKTKSSRSNMSTLSSREEILQQNGVPVFQWAVIFALVGVGIWYACFKGKSVEAGSPANRLGRTSAKATRANKKTKGLTKGKVSTSGVSKTKLTEKRKNESRTRDAPVESLVQVKEKTVASDAAILDVESKIEFDTSIATQSKRKKKNRVKQQANKKKDIEEDHKIENTVSEQKADEVSKFHPMSSEASAPDSTSTDGSSAFDSDDDGEWQTVGHSSKQVRSNNQASVVEAASYNHRNVASITEKSIPIEESLENLEEVGSAVQDDASLARMLQDQENAAAYGISNLEETWEEVTTKKKKGKKEII